MSSIAVRALTLSIVAGTGIGIAARFTPIGGTWLVALLTLSGAVVAIAQQTLP